MVIIQEITKEQMKRLTGKIFLGFSDYRKKKIYVLKSLSKRVKRETILHEQGHFIFRKRRIYIGKKLKKEIKRTPLYKGYKKDYKHKQHKIPEELIVQLRGEIKSSRMGKQQIRYIKSNYPLTYKKMRSLK